jgi:hypothetical protein
MNLYGLLKVRKNARITRLAVKVELRFDRRFKLSQSWADLFFVVRPQGENVVFFSFFSFFQKVRTKVLSEIVSVELGSQVRLKVRLASKSNTHRRTDTHIHTQAHTHAVTHTYSTHTHTVTHTQTHIHIQVHTNNLNTYSTHQDTSLHQLKVFSLLFKVSR